MYEVRVDECAIDIPNQYGIAEIIVSEIENVYEVV